MTSRLMTDMPLPLSPIFLLALLVAMAMPGQTFAQSPEKVVVAHRGASGYLPEHTLAAKVLAHAQGADFIEQDVVMSRDDQLIVIHDLTLERTTDVADRFPERARADGSFYVIDFTLAELRQLQVSEMPNSGRFPTGQSVFRLHTLAEEIELVQGLNQTTGRDAGLYVEAKSPWFHHQHGKDLSRAILETLADYGYTAREDRVYLQTFDYPELLRIHDELLPTLEMDIQLVQLIAWNDWLETYQRDGDNWVPYDYRWMFERAGIQEIARYADGIGPSMDMVVEPGSTAGNLQFTPLVGQAHAAGLVVHPYTFRRDLGRLPAYAEDFDRLLDIFFLDAGVDGVFTDFPDLVVDYLDNLH
jgi:glycerophosphoryl diester phosphodiesterase